MKELNELLNREFQKYIQAADSTLKDALRKEGLIISGKLFESFRFRLSTGEDMAEVLVLFEKYGRFRDIKKISFNKQPPVNLIKEWVERVGISNFKYIPGYEEKKKPETETQAANRIAWGIALNYKKRDKVAVKPWGYNKLMWAEINELERNISKQFTQQMKDELMKYLKQRTI